MQSRIISERGIELIKKLEGLRLKAYKCSAGVWTIGYGTTRGVHDGMTITKERAQELLETDLIAFENGVDDLVKVELSQHQFDALVCFVYNIGLGAFEKSTLLKNLNRGWYEQVPAQMMRWNKAGGKEVLGLTRRREKEAALWRGVI